MAEETRDMQVQETEKQEVAEGDVERTRARRCFVPRTDIYEIGGDMYLAVDMPGVEDKSVDITLERNILTINGYVDPIYPENHQMAYAEYDVGDYQRSFRLSNMIDRDKIDASIHNGVLRLKLAKAGEAKTRKIEVKAA